MQLVVSFVNHIGVYGRRVFRYRKSDLTDLRQIQQIPGLSEFCECSGLGAADQQAAQGKTEQAGT